MATPAVAGATPTGVRAHLLLPDRDGKPVRNTLEPFESTLLTESLTPVLDKLHPEGDYYIGQDTGIYWQRTLPPEQGVKSPDWYVVLGVPRLLDGEYRRSYVLYEELVAPFLVAEYSSGNSDEERDQTPGTGKFWVYERRINASYYVIYEPERASMDVYQRVGSRFRRMAANERGRYEIPELGIELGIWNSVYGGYELGWLRAWDNKGNLLLADAERAERLAVKLRELGIDPASI